MSSYIHFTEEQKQRAAAVDLEEFLRCRGEKLLSSGRERYPAAVSRYSSALPLLDCLSSSTSRALIHSAGEPRPAITGHASTMTALNA